MHANFYDMHANFYVSKSAVAKGLINAASYKLISIQIINNLDCSRSSSSSIVFRARYCSNYDVRDISSNSEEINIRGEVARRVFFFPRMINREI